jgi:hypothetical protein
MSSSSPVPDLRPPNSGVAYQLLCHACPPPPLVIPGAASGWSPSDVPPGPTAAADAIVSRRTVDALEAGLDVADAAGAGLADTTAAGRAAAWTAVRGAEERPIDVATVKIRSPTATPTMRMTRAAIPAVHLRSGLACSAGSLAGSSFT